MNDNTTLSSQQSPEKSDPTPALESYLGSIANSVSPAARCHSLLAPDITQAVDRVTVSIRVKFYLQSLARELLPDERVSICLRSIAPHNSAAGVDVVFSPTQQKARFRNLVICGRVWIDPVCSARITEGRRAELSEALAAWPGTVALATFTLRHAATDRLADLLPAFLRSWRFFVQGKQWQALKSAYGLAGFARSLEVTHGDHGWHPHSHPLLFFSPEMPICDVDHITPEMAIAGLAGDFSRRWRRALDHFGHDASWEHGVDIRTADDDVRDYIAKYGHEPIDPGWTIERELTKGPAKIATTPHGRTPFQLLCDYGAGDKQAGVLFQEYAQVFKGRRQLEWSHGFRKRLGLADEKSDDELASAPLSPDELLLANLTPEQWRIVLRRDLRADILEQARAGDPVLLAAWIAERIGIPERVNLDHLMWSEYERKHGRNEP